MASDKDYAIQQVSTVPTSPPKPMTPTYLVVIEPETGKALSYLVATRFDEHQAYAKFVGFYCKAPEADIINDTMGVLEKASKEDYIECWLPWGQIKKVRSLTYRHKQLGK